MDAVYRLEGARVVTGPMAGGPWKVLLTSA